MKTVIVPIKYGSSLTRTTDGWFLFEVDKALLLEPKRSIALHEFQACRTLNDVRQLINPRFTPCDPNEQIPHEEYAQLYEGDLDLLSDD